MISSWIEKDAKKNAKEIQFFRTSKHIYYCAGCARYDVPNFARELCRACYANWMRQKKKWKQRKTFEPIKGSYRQKAEALYGKNPHCNICGRRALDVNVFECPWVGMYEKNKIHIHHIDANPKNNHPSNLEPLCASCHKQGHIDKTKSIHNKA